MSRTKPPFNIQEDQPTDWFETLYAKTDTDGAGIPWANMDTHSAFKAWLEHTELCGLGKTALVIGCGMGDDAIALEQLGFEVTAFDVSQAAIELCQKRFAGSSVNFLQADLLRPQPQWQHSFDFVLEIYTVQALPPKYEMGLIESIASFAAPNGQVLVVADVSNAPRSFENGPPWKLVPQHVEAFAAHGLAVESRMTRASEITPGGTLFVTTFRRRS